MAGFVPARMLLPAIRPGDLRSIKSFADLSPAGEAPGIGESFALERFHGLDATMIFTLEENARAVFEAAYAQPSAGSQ